MVDKMNTLWRGIVKPYYAFPRFLILFISAITHFSIEFVVGAQNDRVSSANGHGVDSLFRGNSPNFYFQQFLPARYEEELQPL